MKANISDLWKKEDWLAVWIGFAVIAIGCIAVLTGAFDFAAAKFSTWHLWENVAEKKSLLAQLDGAFWENSSALSWFWASCSPSVSNCRAVK